MSRKPSSARVYLETLEHDNPQYLTFYQTLDQGLREQVFSASQIAELSLRAATYLKDQGLVAGDRILFGFGENRPEDLVFRNACAFLGLTPVTVNHSADDSEMVRYKYEKASCRAFLHHVSFPEILFQALTTWEKDVPLLKADFESLPPTAIQSLPVTNEEADKLIVFTSGTTNKPKGVRLPFRAYTCNAATFDGFLADDAPSKVVAIVVNPLHHTNSSAISDWASRRPGSQIHLFDRYGSHYWQSLIKIRTSVSGRVVAPLTARHFDFLETLLQNGRLPYTETQLQTMMSDIDFLLGSAPVGTATVERLLRFSGKPPLVRFGSTETCLQVMGTPRAWSIERRMQAFKAGWQHGNGEEKGFLIGRPHKPHTEVRVVRSVNPNDDDFLQLCDEGESGFFITKGGNLMTAYVADKAATKAVFAQGWYLGLLDIGFYLTDTTDGQANFYWRSRSSTLLIRGGANYAYDRVAEVLTRAIREMTGIREDQFEAAVVGIKVGSEHEDSCCLAITWLDEGMDHKALEAQLRETSWDGVKKAYRPDFIYFGPVPRNFKGLPKYKELQALFSKRVPPKP